ncbi:uncharacterized protein LOC112561654 isoform X3 [Pomacea canaliculata]|uniref:uncharacterized protein LOC112561654 isoform X3 n=1 Tax=Pomacea canaliculata TaxID=400727 RepID=UPI000D73122B|nr:uncharacterized protein LOC112561654 isoform X3 [Pomacea canaliculata]
MGTDIRLGYKLKPKPEVQTLLTKHRNKTPGAAYKCAHIERFKLVVYVCPRQHSHCAQTNLAFSQLLNVQSVPDQTDISSYFQPCSQVIPHKSRPVSVSSTNVEGKRTLSSITSVNKTKVCTHVPDLASAERDSFPMETLEGSMEDVTDQKDHFVNRKRKGGRCMSEVGKLPKRTALKLTSSYQDTNHCSSSSKSGHAHGLSRSISKKSLKNIIQRHEKNKKEKRAISLEMHTSTLQSKRSPVCSHSAKENGKSRQMQRETDDDMSSVALPSVSVINLGAVTIASESESCNLSLSPQMPTATKGCREKEIHDFPRHDADSVVCMSTGKHKSHMFVSSQLDGVGSGKNCRGRTKRGIYSRIKEFHSKHKANNSPTSHLQSLNNSFKVKKVKSYLSVCHKSVHHVDYEKAKSVNVLSQNLKDELPDLVDRSISHQYSNSFSLSSCMEEKASLEKVQPPLKQTCSNGRLPLCSSCDEPEIKARESCQETESHEVLFLEHPVTQKSSERRKRSCISNDQFSPLNVLRLEPFSTCVADSKKGCGLLSIPDTELEKSVLRLRTELEAVKQGNHYSRRHEQYMEGGKCRRLLDDQNYLEHFKEGQEDVVMDTLLTMFPKTDVQSLDYIMRVLLPEALIRVYQQVMGHSVEDI